MSDHNYFTYSPDTGEVRRMNGRENKGDLFAIEDEATWADFEGRSDDAIEWYRKAASLGSVQGIRMISARTQELGSETEVRQKILSALHSGNYNAQNRLEAGFFERDVGNYFAALAWLLPLAEEGLEEAAHAIVEIEMNWAEGDLYRGLHWARRLGKMPDRAFYRPSWVIDLAQSIGDKALIVEVKDEITSSGVVERYIEFALEYLSTNNLDDALEIVQELEKLHIDAVEELRTDIEKRKAPAPASEDKAKKHRSERNSAQERDKRIIELRIDGWTLEQIAKKYGLSRERIRQIVKNLGGPTKDDIKSRQQAAAVLQTELVSSQIATDLNMHGPSTIDEVSARIDRSPADVRKAWPSHMDSMRIRHHQASSRWSDEDYNAALQLAATFDYPLRSSYYDELVRGGEIDGPSAVRIIQKFGTWSAACVNAGVEPGAAPRSDYQSKWTDKDILEFVRSYLESPGSDGTLRGYEEWQRQGGEYAPSGSTLRNRMGTWRETKKRAYLDEQL